MNEAVPSLLEQVRRLKHQVWILAAISAVLLVAVLYNSATSRRRKASDSLEALTLRSLTIIDDKGTERVRIAAPLPDPINGGKRTKRDEPASGILIFDANGNERGGYITDNGAGNALLTLDDGTGEDQVTIVSYFDKGAEFGLRAHAETRFYVSALNDRTALKLQHKDSVLLTEDSRK